MAARKLAVNTTVAGTTYEAGTVPPDEVASQITNPKAWGEGQDGPPPQSGKGSGVEAWREYASTHSVAFDEDATRDDIIAAIAAAGVAVE